MPLKESDPNFRADVDLSKRLEFLVAVASRIFGRTSTKALSDVGITERHYSVMASVDGKKVNQITLADKLQLNRNVMVKLIDDLEKKQLATRESNPENRREYFILLTSAGRSALEEADKIMIQVEKQILEPLNEREKELVCSLMAKIVRPHVGW